MFMFPGSESETAVPDDTSASLEDAVQVIESLFAEYAGFRHSSALNRKIRKVIDGKEPAEINAWIQYMVNQKDKNELRVLAEDLTNHETFFFRDEIQLKVLEQHLLPEIIKRKKKQKDRVIRLWSAACSTGEEAYSMAMIAVDYMVRNNMAYFSEKRHLTFKDGWQLKVYGTDISNQVVAIARNAMYVDGGLSPFRGDASRYMDYFKDKGSSQDRLYNKNAKVYEVVPAVRRLVHFDTHNLNQDELPIFLKEMDVVFARNLMIYLNQDSQQKIQQKFQKSLVKGGYLVMSAVDTLRHTEGYKEVILNSTKNYQRR